MKFPYNLRYARIEESDADAECSPARLESSSSPSPSSSAGSTIVETEEVDHFPLLKVAFVYQPPPLVYAEEPFGMLIDTRKVQNWFITVQVLRDGQEIDLWGKSKIVEDTVRWDDIKLIIPGMYTFNVYLSRVKKDWKEGVCDLDPTFEVRQKFCGECMKP
ncbi:hypothetical protein Micbo1qcDRAFT_179928 [Microdochium bolleyi]|uniref:Uncharacterized protein n=1 Tax=Microdochium bolleyi TaxID=196109 RepID=A0A136IN71_9PEZI|nr:hypothetical protein Micbo1qcDRAFT_179928 [Microdochium bolleyi]